MWMQAQNVVGDVAVVAAVCVVVESEDGDEIPIIIIIIMTMTMYGESIIVDPSMNDHLD